MDIAQDRPSRCATGVAPHGAEGAWARRSGFWVGVNIVSLIGLSLLMFWLQAPVTYYRYDGTFILATALNQGEWTDSLLHFGMDPLKGTGGQVFPMMTPLFPGFALGIMGGLDWLPALSATWFALEFAVTTVFLGRVIGVRLPAAVLGAWIGLLGALPYLVRPPALERLWGNPHLLTTLACASLALSLFLLVGRGSRSRDAALGAGILATLVYDAFSQPLALLIVAPFLGFFGLGAACLAEGARERWTKLAVGGTVAAVSAALLGPYIAGLALFTKVTYFWSELFPTKVDWHWASFFVEDLTRRPLGPYFLAAALLGAALWAWSGDARQRRFALLYLAYVAVLWLITAFFWITGRTWNGPSISYLDLCAYPLHVLFAGVLVWEGLAKLADWLGWAQATPAVALGAAAALPWMALIVWVPPYSKPLFKNDAPFSWPPTRVPIVERLEREIALHPGQPFRGRVANLAGAAFQPEYRHAPFVNQHNYDAMVALYLGNDHREYGLWTYGIPTLDDTNPAHSPYFYLLAARLLNPDGAVHTRPHTTAARFAPTMLEQLGVRFVQADEPIEGRTPVLTVDVVATRKHYLYELANPNLGGRSVTRVSVAPDVRAAVERLEAADLDLTQEAVLFDALPPGPLVPASASRLILERGAIRVAAESPGRSLLVLPVSFTRCLTFDWGASGGPPQAFRANLDQTAVLFEGRIEGRIGLKNGPFSQPGCRLDDMKEAVRLKLGEAARPVTLP